MWGSGLSDAFTKLFGWLTDVGLKFGPIGALIALPLTALNWVLTDLLGTFILQKLQGIGDALDAMALSLDLTSVGVSLSEVGTVFPFAYFGQLVAAYLVLWGLVVGVKWILKLIPTVG